MFKFTLNSQSIAKTEVTVRTYTQKKTGVKFFSGKIEYDGTIIYRATRFLEVPDVGKLTSMRSFEFAGEMLNAVAYTKLHSQRQRLAAIVTLRHLTINNRRKYSVESYESMHDYITRLHQQLMLDWDMKNYN